MTTLSTKTSSASKTNSVANNFTKENKSAKPMEATALLTADHKAVSDLFAEYEKATSAAKKKQLVTEICTELTVQAKYKRRFFTLQ